MITRENHEEFFLLYADNELPAETRQAVERFAGAHPDLREELEALLQCRLEPESDQPFPQKDSLLRYEETFLAYIDGELDEAGRNAVETLVQRDAVRAGELEQLLMTVSRPDPGVVFPDKESLYKTTKRRRVVMLPWLQVGAAAAVLAAVALAVLPKAHRPAGMPAIAATAPAAAHAPGITPVPAKNTQPAVTSAGPAALHPIKNAVAARHKETNNLKASPAPMVAVTTTVTAGTTTVSDTGSRSSKLLAIAPAHPDQAALPVTTAVAVNIPRDQSSFATQALLKEAQEDGAGDMADNLQQPAGKTKLRGLFRRVTRAFGKTADRDDDGQRQLLISAFQVALK